MRSRYLTALLFIVFSSFVSRNTIAHLSGEGKKLSTATCPGKILDFNVRRFSGEKVFLSWHTQDDAPGTVYEVLRKYKMLSQFVSLGIVESKSAEGYTGDYTFIDVNNYSDSSYYCLRKTTADSVVFFSATKGVEGVQKYR